MATIAASFRETAEHRLAATVGRPLSVDAVELEKYSRFFGMHQTIGNLIAR
jgi:hypothetical protein